MDIYSLFPASNPNPPSQVNVSTNGEEIFVISDLHIASGLNTSSNYDGTENFFADQSFVRFIDRLEKKSNGKPALLIINGDFVDFLRICGFPESDTDFLAWQTMLALIGIAKSTDELRNSIVTKEKIFGLRTNDFKSVWKLHACIQGHQALFERLALWLQSGNKLIISKGNHDLEWYWTPVQNYLLYYFALLLSKKSASPVETLLPDIISRTTFVNHAMVIDKKIYLEHGHCYENITSVKGDTLSADKTELNLPFGSFFNRYLVNKVELSYPFIDNVRPRQNIMLILMRERFPLAIKMIFSYLPFTLLLIPKKLYWQVFKYLFTFILIIVVPVAITAYAIYRSIPHGIPAAHANDTPWIVTQVLSVAKNLGFLFLSYIFGRIMTFVKLQDPGSFLPDAEKIFSENIELEVVSFGHTHNPEQFNRDTKWYFNTGTWMPVFEASSADIRIDKTYTFLHLGYDSTGKLIIRPLQRWNDDAIREEDMILTEKK